MKTIGTLIAIFSVPAGAYCQHHEMTKYSWFFAGLMVTAMIMVTILTKAPVEKETAVKNKETVL